MNLMNTTHCSLSYHQEINLVCLLGSVTNVNNNIYVGYIILFQFVKFRRSDSQNELIKTTAILMFILFINTRTFGK